MNTIGETIKKHREKLGLSQIRAAKEIGISHGLLAQLEQGKESVRKETAEKIEKWIEQRKESGK